MNKILISNFHFTNVNKSTLIIDPKFSFCILKSAEAETRIIKTYLLSIIYSFLVILELTL
jgi:hypothetical protein